MDVRSLTCVDLRDNVQYETVRAALHTPGDLVEDSSTRSPLTLQQRRAIKNRRLNQILSFANFVSSSGVVHVTCDVHASASIAAWICQHWVAKIRNFCHPSVDDNLPNLTLQRDGAQVHAQVRSARPDLQ